MGRSNGYRAVVLTTATYKPNIYYILGSNGNYVLSTSQTFDKNATYYEKLDNIFRPVRGTEEKINEFPITNGYVYFATDTGHIYLDKNGERIPVGGGKGASIYYSTSTEIQQNDETYYVLDRSMLNDPDTKCQVGDIIINSDGSFYRISLFPDDAPSEIWCDRINAGGSGGEGPSSLKKISVKIGAPATTNLINGQEFYIDVTATSAVEADGSILDDKLQITWSLSEKTSSGAYSLYHSKTIDVTQGETIKIEIGSAMRENSTIKLMVYAYGINSGKSSTRSIDFNTANLELRPAENFSNLNLFETTNVSIQCNVIGNTEKLLYYYWDDQVLEDMPLALGAQATVLQSYNVPASLATHGRHTVRIELYQDVNGSNGLKAGELSFEIAVKGNSDNPIIWVNGYKKVYYDYEIIQIPFQVYDPLANTATIHLYRSNKEIDGSPRTITRDAVSPKFELWEITDAQTGAPNSYSITCGEDERFDRYDLTFEVEETDKLKLAFPDKMTLKFDATGRSNSESATNRERWINPIEQFSNYVGTFKDFNWYNNGWLTDDDSKTHLRISNGAQFNISYAPMKFSAGVEGENSWTIEMQFKVSNLKNYQSLITNYTRYPNDSKYWEGFQAQIGSANGYTNYDAYLRSILGDKTDEFCQVIERVEKVINTKAAICKFYDGERGFCLGPQDAFFTTKQDTVNVNYVEDEMVHLAIVFNHNNQFISIYLNGVLSGIAKSTIGGQFTINSNTIEFNSEYCDVNLYKLRIYRTNLAINYIDLNLAADQKDIDVYDQTNLALYNSALYEYQFNYENMLEYNKTHPDNELMPYVIWTTHGKTEDDNKLPYSKANVINASMEFHNVALDRAFVTGQLNDLATKDGLTDEECLEKYGMTAVQYYYLHHCPSWHGDNIEMKVQGTSSEFYPRRNYKCKTKTKNETGKKVVNMYMNEGPFEGTNTHTNWFYYDNYTVGTSKFTMKIDFMESSGTYNVGFANLVNNAYSKHPLDDYNKAGAFVVIDKDNQIITPVESLKNNYDPDTVYYYYNHKGNLKNTKDDELKSLSSADDFILGPRGYAQKINQKKVLGGIETEPIYSDDALASDIKDKLVECTNVWYYLENSFKEYAIPDTQNYRTSVQGFPVLAFHKREDTGEIKYIGRYNMILDKGADEAYGFAIDNVFQKFADYKEVSKVAECWEFSDNIGTFCSFRDPNSRDNLEFKVLKEDGTQSLTENGAPIVANSFEYRYHNDSDDIDIVYDLTNADTDNLSALAQNQGLTGLSPSNREPAREWLLDVMKNWEKACAWIWSTCTDVVPTEKEIAMAIESNNWSAIESKYGKTQEKITFDSPKHYGSKDYSYDSQECRLAKFQAELADHFDIDYTATYFVMTEVFECYDSRGKNAMMASWGPLKEGGEYIWYPIFYDIDTQLGINNTGIPSFTFDIDATKDGCFSTNNSVLWTNFYKCYQNSYIRQKYRQLRGYTDSSINKDIFGTLTTPPLDTVARIERWYLADPDECGRGLTRTSTDKRPFLAMKGQRPLIALNLDEYYKYITITNNNISAGGGYLGQNGEWISDNSNGKPTGSFFYALQGDRSLSRQQFLTDRLNYIDSWLKCGEFQRGEGSGQVWGRISANIPSEFPDLWVADPAQQGNTEGENLEYAPYWTDETETVKTNEFDAEYWVTLTPARSTYLTIGLDNNAIGGDSGAAGSDETEDVSLKYKGSPVKIMFPVDIAEKIRTQPKKHQQLLYLYAASQMTDLGDMSKLYWSEFHMTNDCKKLTRLLLGNDNFDCLNNQGSQYGYYRHGTQPLSLKSMPLLQEMCLSGIRTSGSGGVTYDLSYSEKLKSFRALRTDITSMTFAKGVALNTLYLPDCTTNIKLTEARQLTNLLTEYPVTKGENVGEYICEKGLYIEQLFDKDSPSTQINNITLIGDKLGYDSYKLISQVANLAKGEVQITVEGLDWCPYKLVDEGSIYDTENASLYYKDDKHYGFTPYEYVDENTWNLNILNGEVYKLNQDIFDKQSDLITSDTLINKLATDSKFKSATESQDIPSLKGIIYIKNIDKVSEAYIRNDLQVKYPNLQFFFANVDKAYSAEFQLLESDGSYQVLETQKIDPSDISTTWFENPYTKYKKPTKLDHDFIGWATSPEGGDSIIEETDEAWAATKEKLYKSGTYDYTFYAIFVLHRYAISFYDGNGNLIVENPNKPIYDDTGKQVTMRISYGENIPEPSVIPTKDDSSLPLEETYAFLGYSRKTNGEPISSKNWSKEVALEDRSYYSIFSEPQSVYLSPIDTKYLKLTKKINRNSQKEYYSIAVKDGIELSGKVVLPTTYEGLPIVEVEEGEQYENYTKNGFDHNSKITAIFWSPKGSMNLENIGRNAFCYMPNLIYFDFPDSVNTIGMSAFYQSNLSYNNRMPANLGTYSSTYRSQGMVATGAFSNTQITKQTGKVLYINSALETIPYAYTFAYDVFEAIVFGENEVGKGSKITTIDTQAFCAASNRKTLVTRVDVFYDPEATNKETIMAALNGLEVTFKEGYTINVQVAGS